MTPQPPVDPLQNLKDIALPSPISQWPAYGWWLLLALVILGLIAVGIYFWLRHRRLAYQREALTHLQTLENKRLDYSESELTTQVSELLKRVAMTREGRDQCASLSGDAWLTYLDQTGKTTDFTQGAGRALGSDQFNPATTVDLEGLFRVSHKWIQSQK